MNENGIAPCVSLVASGAGQLVTVRIGRALDFDEAIIIGHGKIRHLSPPATKFYGKRCV